MENTALSTKDNAHFGSDVLRIFEKQGFGKIRTIEIDDKVYFVASDVAKALGYTNTSKAINDHCRWVTKRYIPHPQSKTKTLEVNVIPQGDVIRLASNSELPGAEKFESWIYDEVIPSVLNYGMYAVDELLENPDIAIKAFTALKEEREKNKRLEQEKKALEYETIEMSKAITEMQPKANYVDVILQSKSTVCTTQIAQDYGMSATAFNKLLNRLGIQHKVGKQWILYRPYISQGYVQSETVSIERSNGMLDTVMHTKWTQKGRLFLYETLKDNGYLPLIEQDIAS